ncbi:MAG: hypothetical protein K5668_08005, partial [Lachnospiraceae bacterium]|nr:hypothetical protein [Lachnospiraceae bacterium]
TVIKGSKFTTRKKLKDRKAVKTTGGIKVRVNKKTLKPKITCKRDGSLTLTMEDGVTYTITFIVQKPKARENAKHMSKGGRKAVKTIKDLFGTDIDAGELTIRKQKYAQATISGNNLYIDPRQTDSIKVRYLYLNKKYKITIKVQ